MTDPTDRAIIEATQAGLPLVPAPFAVLAETLGISEQEMIERLKRMKAQGIIRRIGAAPNHYRLGLTANGMTVWDVDDAAVDTLGEMVGALPFVTHCYRRPPGASRLALQPVCHGPRGEP
ncbi:Lrp/AsnC family transcriptional regulator [Roseibium salinum]|nr:Lrp/AsnC family transcriptional regulator [Roseibium salinum]